MSSFISLYRLPVLIALMLFCVLVFRFISNLPESSVSNHKTESLTGLLDVSKLKLDADYQKQLLAKYSELKANTEEQSEQTVTTLSEAEQLKQSGELSELYIGDAILTLKAVINYQDAKTSQQPAALIYKSNVKTGESSLDRVEDESVFMDFAVRVLSNQKVELSRQLSDKVQTIELVMYESGT